MIARSETSQPEINAVAWAACDTFCGATDPESCRNYILAFIFLKYLSDLWKDKLERYREELKGDEERVRRRMSRERFVIPEGCDFDTLFSKRNETNIGELINLALAKIEDANKAKIEGVFRNIDFNSESLGETKDRNRRLKRLIEDFADPRLDMRPSRIGAHNVAGQTFEHLIKQFAGAAGKKSGDFYTPPEVSELLAGLMSPKGGARVCDPACGSGSLLIRLAVEAGDIALFGQEAEPDTWAICRMNMILHDQDGARIEPGNTLTDPKLIDGPTLMKFDLVVANPPLTMGKWDAEAAARDKFTRFHRGIPPKSKADYAFITHLIATTVEDTGRAAVIAPHGVLFRGGAEGKIRRKLIEENLIEAVIGLPANLFYGAAIPAAILTFNRGKKTTDLLFIDASRDYQVAKNQNRLRREDLEKIVSVYQKFATVENYSYRATLDEIRQQDFNLSIRRYVNRFEEEEIDLQAIQTEIGRLEEELEDVRREIKQCLDTLDDRKR